MSSTSEMPSSRTAMVEFLTELVGFGSLLTELERAERPLPESEIKSLTQMAFHASVLTWGDDELAEAFEEAVLQALLSQLGASQVPRGRASSASG